MVAEPIVQTPTLHQRTRRRGRGMGLDDDTPTSRTKLQLTSANAGWSNNLTDRATDHSECRPSRYASALAVASLGA